uniref:RING-type domain-containing protein n=1 Tax=Panagrolaimus davidi TaxID=227884 RepID=A0A914QUH2_9BILA
MSNIYAISKCGHTFHQKCINQWVSSANNCPTCRTNAFQSDIIKLFIQENNVEIPQSLTKPKRSPTPERRSRSSRRDRNDDDHYRKRRRSSERRHYQRSTSKDKSRSRRCHDSSASSSSQSPRSLPYIEKKYDGCSRRIMKECKCEIDRYETGDLQYKCLKDFDINICSYKKAGIIQIIFPDEIIVKTYQSKKLDIIRGKTNKISTVDPDGKLFEYYSERTEFLNTTRNKETIRSNEDIVRQGNYHIRFRFPRFTIIRSLKNGEVTIFVYTDDPKKSLEIQICSEHQSFFVEHLFEKKISRCTNSEFLCDHLYE